MWDRNLRQQTSSEQAYLSHALYRHFWQGNFHAPIQQSLTTAGAYVIDVGCSSEASWLVDMASEYPAAQFLGIDRTGVFPPAPANVEFRQCDVLSGLPYPDETFSYTHMTNMTAQFTQAEWESVVAELVRVTKNGGWIELLEPECKYANEGSCTAQFTDALDRNLKAQGVNGFIAEELGPMLKATGSVRNIQHAVRSIPLGRRGSGGLEDIARDHVKFTFQRARGLLLAELNITMDEYDRILNLLLQELDTHNTSITSHRVFGQKRP